MGRRLFRRSLRSKLTTKGSHNFPFPTRAWQLSDSQRPLIRLAYKICHPISKSLPLGGQHRSLFLCLRKCVTQGPATSLLLLCHLLNRSTEGMWLLHLPSFSVFYGVIHNLSEWEYSLTALEHFISRKHVISLKISGTLRSKQCGRNSPTTPHLESFPLIQAEMSLAFSLGILFLPIRSLWPLIAAGEGTW